MDEDTEVAKAREAVEQILKCSDKERLLEALDHWATVPPSGEFVVGPGIVHEERAVFKVWDSAEPGNGEWPHLAHLTRDHRGWFLTSILSQCTGCFGSGLLPEDGSPCPVCLARGWGLLESEDFVLSQEGSDETFGKRRRALQRVATDPTSAAATRG